MSNRRRYPLTALLLALMLVGAACGDSTDTATTVAPTAAATEAPAPTEAPFDINAVAASYLKGIPEGWMAVGDLTAFKDAKDVGGALLIDVREASEYAEGHIEGAVNIPIRTIADHLDMIPTDRQVFIYCQSGFRAAIAGSALQMLGYDNVLIFPPSYKGWTEADEPVSTDAVDAETFTVPEIAPELLSAVGGFLSGIPEGYLSAGDVEKVKEAMGAGAFLLDVRTPEEYAEGHLPGAVNVSLRDLTDGLDEIPTDTNVIVYCGSGHRAALAIPVLHSLGFDNAKAFGGSYKAWKEAGEEIVTT